VTLRVEREGVIQRIRAKSVRRPRARTQFTVIRDRNFSNPRRRERRRPAPAWPRSARDPNRAFVGRFFLASPGLRAWPSLLRPNPTDYSVDNLVIARLVESITFTQHRGSPRCQVVQRSHRIASICTLHITSCRHCGSTACGRCHAAHESLSSVTPCVPRLRRRSKRTTSWQSRRATLISSMSSADGHARISPMMAPPTTPVSLPRCLFSSAA
jgi:hypothetical protein